MDYCVLMFFLGSRFDLTAVTKYELEIVSKLFHNNHRGKLKKKKHSKTTKSE